MVEFNLWKSSFINYLVWVDRLSHREVSFFYSPHEGVIATLRAYVCLIEYIGYIVQYIPHLYSITDKVIPTLSTPRALRSTSFFIASPSILNLISQNHTERITNALKLNLS